MPAGHTHPMPDRGTLYSLYWDNGLSQQAIAERYGVGSSSVCRWMKKLNIPQRQLNPNMYKDWEGAPHRDPELLRRLYWDEELNTVQIAKQLDMSDSVIGLWMERLGIPKRDQAMATHLAVGNSIKLSDEAMSFLAGSLLGDGSLIWNKSISAFYSHTSKHKDYLKWLRAQFKGYGLEPIGTIRKQPRYYKGSKVSYTYSFATRSYPELGVLRRKWYPNEKKQPPQDLILNGLSLRQWFIGDGNYRERHRNNRFEREVRISNFAFSQDSREFLATLFHRLHIGVTLPSDGFRVRNQYIDHFFQVIGPCPVPEIYGYKWPTASKRQQLGLL